MHMIAQYPHFRQDAARLHQRPAPDNYKRVPAPKSIGQRYQKRYQKRYQTPIVCGAIRRTGRMGGNASELDTEREDEEGGSAASHRVWVSYSVDRRSLCAGETGGCKCGGVGRAPPGAGSGVGPQRKGPASPGFSLRPSGRLGLVQKGDCPLPRSGREPEKQVAVAGGLSPF